MNLKTLALTLTVTLIAVPAAVHACNAFLMDEYQDGNTKYCIYDHLSDTHMITVRAHRLCPTSVYVSH